MTSLCQKGKKKMGITEFVLEIKRITDHRIFRTFGHLVRFLIQQKVNYNEQLYLRYVCLFQHT